MSGSNYLIRVPSNITRFSSSPPEPYKTEVTGGDGKRKRQHLVCTGGSSDEEVLRLCKSAASNRSSTTSQWPWNEATFLGVEKPQSSVLAADRGSRKPCKALRHVDKEEVDTVALIGKCTTALDKFREVTRRPAYFDEAPGESSGRALEILEETVTEAVHAYLDKKRPKIHSVVKALPSVTDSNNVDPVKILPDLPLDPDAVMMLGELLEQPR